MSIEDIDGGYTLHTAGNFNMSTITGGLKATPEMIEAGVEVFWQSGRVEGELGSDRLLVAEMFQAMLRARG